MHGEVRVAVAEASNEMVLECSDGPFCGIATVDSRGNKLEINIFFMGKFLQGYGAFVVQSV